MAFVFNIHRQNLISIILNGHFSISTLGVNDLVAVKNNSETRGRTEEDTVRKFIQISVGYCLVCDILQRNPWTAPFPKRILSHRWAENRFECTSTQLVKDIVHLHFKASKCLFKWGWKTVFPRSWNYGDPLDKAHDIYI